MADYINTDILCQAYLHIDPVPVDVDELAALKKELEQFISSRGKFFIYDEVNTSVEFKEGSLKVYATIVGSIFIAIGQYGSFRAGVDFLSSDVKRLSETIVSESLFLTKSHHQNIVRVESRIGVIGSLKKIVDEIDYIKSQSGMVDSLTLVNRIGKLSDNIFRMQGNLKDPEDIPYVKDNLAELIEINIPATPVPTPEKPISPELKEYYINERRKLISTVKT